MGSWPKIKVYLSFTALAVFFAEAVGGNYPAALLNPLIYLAYGIPFMLLLDDLVNFAEDRFHPWYLSGWLVGWVTEAYVAKVVFYGWPNDHQQYLGFAVGPILLVIFFYHAWITFLLPAYVARRILGFPFPITVNKKRDLLAMGTALALGLLSTHISLTQGRPIPKAILELILSFFVLVLIIRSVKKLEKIEEFRLTRDERTRIIRWGIAIYLLFYISGATEPHVKGQLAPFWPCIVSLFITTLLWGGLWRAARRNRGIPDGIPPYDPEVLNTSGWGRWLSVYLFISLIVQGTSPLLLGSALPSVVVGILVPGILFGILCGLYSFASLFRDLVFR